MMSVDHELAERLYREGRSAWRSGDRQLAIRRFRESIAAAPHFKTCELLGECLLEAGRPVEAIYALAAAAGLGQNPFRAKCLLARALLDSGQPLDALAAVDEAIRLNPSYRAAEALRDELLKLEAVQAAIAREREGDE